MRTDRRPRRRFTIERSARARCSPAQVRRLLVDPGTWPSWQPEIVDTDRSGELERGEVVRGRARMLGFDVWGHSEVLTSDGESFEEDAIVGIRMRVRYEVRSEGDGIVIVHELAAELPGGPMGWLLSLFLRGRLRRMQRGALAELAAQAEASS